MKIGQFVEYKGFIGSIEYDSKNKIYYGRLLNADDPVVYYGNTGEELYEYYCKSIDDYIEKKTIGIPIQEIHPKKDGDTYKMVN